MSKNMKIWRESASLILAAKLVFSAQKPFNYQVICLKRSSKSDFMPDTYVFPGGNLSKSDSNIKWLELFKKFGFSNESFNDLKPVENIPEILQSSDDNLVLPKYLSFRICAIREAFEECGILLCKSPKISSSEEINSKWAAFIGGHELIQWQHRIHDDASEFLNLCTQFDIFPDVWALKNWSNWITPPSLPLKFNTLFFLATLQQIPPTHCDGKEMQNLMWTTPKQCIDLNSTEEVMLPVPQYYEISRLKTVDNIEDLANFAHDRSKHGFETYWPFRIQTSRGLFSILPGDDLYPDKIDKNVSTVPFVSELPHSVKQNRILHKSIYKNEITTSNLVSKCKHITPYS